MKLILVDTPVKKISLITIGDKLTLPLIYSLIGCRTIEGHRLNSDHGFYCDEEARLKNPLPPALFLEGFEEPIHGRLLIFKSIDCDEASVTISVEEVFSMVFFLP
jgi:hypothetical protein